MDWKKSNSVFQSRDNTYVYLWTYTQFQQEQTEWDSVNRLLQHYGFNPVHFADPIGNNNLADLVLLEKKSAFDLRTMLRTMLTDSERRQTIIQELIQTNSQLIEEAQQHQSRAAQQSHRATELEGVLDGVKSKDLEDSYIGKAVQQHSQVHQLQQDKIDAQRQWQSLEKKLSEEKEVVSQLQRKLYFTVKEKERRVARQNQVFQQIHKRSAQSHSPEDQQVLDVIDVYEAQMEQLQDELNLSLKSLKGGPGGSLSPDQTQSTRGSTEVSSHYKTLLKTYQQQLKETKAQREQLRNEIQQLSQDLESRPTVKELKSYKHQLQRMDIIIKQSKTRSAQVFKEEDNTEQSNMEVGNFTVMEASLCHRYLKYAEYLSAAGCLRLLLSDVCLEGKILNDISEILTSTRAPLQLHRQRPKEISETVEFDGLLSTLEMWAEQMGSLKDLHRALSKLMLRLLPWQPGGCGSRPTEDIKVEDLMLMVDTLLEETATGDKELRSPTKNTLQSMVSHFQKLFDVSSLSGVYPRMNEVYIRLGEMTNAMRNLSDVLALDDRAPPSEVVNQVARVVSLPKAAVGHELQNLLGTSDINSIIFKVKVHEEFFPAFCSLVLELLQTLDVHCLDDIVPALRLLKSRELTLS